MEHWDSDGRSRQGAEFLPSASAPLLSHDFRDTLLDVRQRPCRDKGFAWAFLILISATAALGLYQTPLWSSGENYSVLWKTLMLSPDDICPISYRALANQLGVSVGTFEPGNSNVVTSAFGRGPWRLPLLLIFLGGLVFVMIGGLPVGMSFVWITKTYSRKLHSLLCAASLLVVVGLVLLSLTTQCGVPPTLLQSSGSSFTLVLSSCKLRFVSIGIFGILCSLFLAVARKESTLVMSRESWTLPQYSVKLTALAAYVCSGNSGIFLILPVVLTLLYLVLFFAVFFLIHLSPYKPVLNPKLLPGDVCGSLPSQKSCCVQPGEVQLGYIFYSLCLLGSFCILWAVCVLHAVENFAVSGAIGQWYFAKDEGLRRSLQHTIRALVFAFSTSFGTLCLSGLLQILRPFLLLKDWALKVLHQRSSPSSKARTIQSLGISFAAISGEDLHSSNRLAVDLLDRNLLAPMIGHKFPGLAALGPLLWCALVMMAFVILTLLKNQDLDFPKAVWMLLLLTPFLVLFSFCASFLQQAIHIVCICYAVDLELGTTSKPEMHQVACELFPATQTANPGQ